jgi:hypothetical protein
MTFTLNVVKCVSVIVNLVVFTPACGDDAVTSADVEVTTHRWVGSCTGSAAWRFQVVTLGAATRGSSRFAFLRAQRCLLNSILGLRKPIKTHAQNSRAMNLTECVR